MLRIVEENVAKNSMTFRLDGRLVGEWVEVLRQSCEQAFQNDRPLILDLTGVNFADQEGVQLLRQLEPRVTFIHCSPFLREQIKPSANQESVSEQVVIK